jgi:antitoxin (DNA-binding transcriptional repressor) of toxin-antitoxin stability system
MSAYSVADAQNNLSDLIDRALRGEGVTIVRDGAAVVELKPLTASVRPVAQADLDWLETHMLRPARPPTEDAGELVSTMRDEGTP